MVYLDFKPDVFDRMSKIIYKKKCEDVEIFHDIREED